MRRSVAAEASTVVVRACSRERTRAATGSGPSSVRMRSLSTVTNPRMTHGAAKRKMAPRRNTPTLWPKLDGPEGQPLDKKMPWARPHMPGPPLPCQKIGLKRPKTASHHRLKAT